MAGVELGKVVVSIMLITAMLCDVTIELVVAETAETPKLAPVQIKGGCWLNTT